MGRNVINPLNGKLIPVIADSIIVDPEFGTGAVKITPSLDKNDFECALRKGLPISSIPNDWFLNRGCRRTGTISKLKLSGRIKTAVPHQMTLNLCSRSKDVIEKIVKPQW